MTDLLRKAGASVVRTIAPHLGVDLKGISLADPTLAAIFGIQDKTKLTDPYTQIPVVYAAIKKKATTLGSVPLRLYPVGSDEPLERGPAVDLFNWINPMTSQSEFTHAITSSLDLKGNFYVYPDEEEEKGWPLNLWVVPPDWVKPIIRENVFLGWEIDWQGQKIILTKDELIHGRYFNPHDTVLGLSPLVALSATNDVRWGSVQYSKYFFENDATPGLIIESEHKVTDAQRLRIEQMFFKERQGVKNSHRGLLLDGGATAKTLALSNKDIQLLELQSSTAEEVLYALDVPKTMLSIMEDINYATALQQDRSFWQKTMIPLGTLVTDSINKWLTPRGINARYDWQSIDALNMEVLEKAEASKIFYQIGFTANEINERLNLRFPEAPSRDVPFDPSRGTLDSGQPVRSIGPPAKRLMAPQDASVDMAEAMKARRAAEWKRLDDQTLIEIHRTDADIRRYFRDVENRLKRLFIDNFKNLEEARLKLTRDEINALLADMQHVSDAYDDARMRELLTNHILEAMSSGADSIVGDFGVVDTVARQYLVSRTETIRSINENARTKMEAALRSALADGIEAGLSEESMIEVVLETVGEQMKQARAHARTIARTEVHSAWTAGRAVAIESTDPPRKMWISSRDAKVRPSHAAVDGEIVDFDSNFSNGLSRPYDPTAPAEEVINCRCKFVAIYDPEDV